jgi:hypothetical protein
MSQYHLLICTKGNPMASLSPEALQNRLAKAGIGLVLTVAHYPTQQRVSLVLE